MIPKSKSLVGRASIDYIFIFKLENHCFLDTVVTAACEVGKMVKDAIWT